MITTRNLQAILQSGLVCKAGQMVSTPLFPQMEVFGFVPMKETDRYLDFNMRDTRIVANRVVVAPQEEKPDVFCGTSIKRIGVYPIYKVVETSVSAQKLPLRFLRIVEIKNTIRTIPSSFRVVSEWSRSGLDMIFLYTLKTSLLHLKTNKNERKMNF